MLEEFARIAFSSLRKRLLRTSLTMIGIFIGVATVVALVSLGQGLQDAIGVTFSSIGSDKVLVQAASPGFEPPGQNTISKITDHDLKILRGTIGVDRAVGRLLRSVSYEWDDRQRILFGTSLSEDLDGRELIIEVNNIVVDSGRLLKVSDGRKVLLGSSLWDVERPPRVGSTVLVNGVKFEVVGLLQKSGSPIDGTLIMNEKVMRDLLDEPVEFSALAAQVSKGADPAIVADRVKRSLRRDRGQKEGFEDFTVQTSQEIIETVGTVINVVQGIFIGIALISLFVGGIGIMNTMYTSVLEQTRNIGIMKAIGARNSDVLYIFLFESGILGLAGGVIGVLLGVGLSKLVEIGARSAIGDLIQASFPWYLIVGALAFSFIVGVVSGVFPAIEASRMQPVEALRQ